jgi:hypothetical protein
VTTRTREQIRSVLRRRLPAAQDENARETLLDEWAVEASVQELESVLSRVERLTVTARELSEDLEVRGRVIPLTKLGVRGREQRRPRAMIAAAQLGGVGLGVYAIFVDKLTNIGLLVAALGLLGMRRVLGTRRWRA